MKIVTPKMTSPVNPASNNLIQRYQNVIFLILLCLASIAAYSNSFKVPFHLDDYANLISHPLNHDLSYYAKASTWLHITNRPLSMLSLALNYHFNGLETNAYHLVNLILHILTGFILFFMVLQITRIAMKNEKVNTNWFAFLISLVFILHPLQTEAVTYIAQRTTIMATLFYLLSVFLYGEGRKLHVNSGYLNKLLVLYGLSFLSMIFALESKENAATLPFVLLLYEICFIRDKQDKMMKGYVIAFSGILLLFAAAVIITGHIPRQTELITRGQYFLTQLRVMVQYLQMMVVPIGLNIDHDVKLSTYFFSLPVLLSIITLLVLLETSVYLFKRRRIVSFAILWFFITLSVESSLVPLNDVMVEHRLYLPMAGFAIVLVYSAWYLLGKLGKSLYIVIVVLITILYAGLTIHRNLDWRSEESIWADASIKSPAKPRPYKILADIYMKQGRFKEALTEYNRTIQITPNEPEMYLNYGIALLKTGNLIEAKKAYLHALTLSPDLPKAYFLLGNIAQKEREFIQAAGYYRKALKLRPDYEEASLGLASAYDNMGEHKYAERLYGKITNRDDTTYDAYVKRGKSLLEQGSYKNAIPNFEKAIMTDPTKAEAYYQLGRAYLSSHKLNKALDNWKNALSVNPDYYLAYNDLGTAAYMTQQFKLSIEYWEKSLKIDSKQANIYAMIGSSYYQMGKKTKWKEYYKKASDLGYSPAKKALK